MTNLQTIPRDQKDVKRAFIPKLDCFLFSDYPNIELKLLAFYLQSAGWPSMAQRFRDGADLHVETAAGVFRKPAAEVTDLERQVGKRLNFSIVYGGGVPTLTSQLGIKGGEALALLRSYHETWPGIGWDSKRRPADPGTLIAGIKQRIAERTLPGEPGYITTLYGRHLHPRSMHSALNALCQGCGADLLKWAMIQCYMGLKSLNVQSHLVNCVHDELTFDCKKREVKTLVPLIPEWMTDERIHSVVPIKPECDYSATSWAEKVSYKEVV